MNDCGRTALRTPLNGISVHVWRFIKADEMNRVERFPEARSRLQTSVTSCPALIGYRNDSARFPWTSFLGLLEAQVTRGDPKSGPHSIDFAVAVPTRRNRKTNSRQYLAARLEVSGSASENSPDPRATPS